MEVDSRTQRAQYIGIIAFKIVHRCNMTKLTYGQYEHSTKLIIFMVSDVCSRTKIVKIFPWR